MKVQSTLDKSKLKGPAFNFDLSRVLKYQEFELSSLMLKKFELLSSSIIQMFFNIKLDNSNCSKTPSRTHSIRLSRY